MSQGSRQVMFAPGQGPYIQAARPGLTSQFGINAVNCRSQRPRWVRANELGDSWRR